MNERPRTVSIEEQTTLNLRAQRNFVAPAAIMPARAYEISPGDQSMLQQGATIAGQVLRHELSQHARSDDTAITIAQASLLYSSAYGLIFAGVALPIAIILIFGFGVSGWHVALTAFLAWGAYTMLMLAFNRRQGLHHSPTGIAHHEISSRERIALHAIDRHVDLVEKRWSIGRE